MKARIINSQAEIDEIIGKCEACYVGMADEGQPYVLPFNFGYHEGVIYLHSAQEGKKIGILKKNNRVCIAFSTDHVLRYQSEQMACSYGMKYRSVLAYGRVEFLDDAGEKIRALDYFMKHYTARSFSYNDPAVNNVLVYRIVVEKFEGKAYGY
jgi:nitroimidazol reductase NimA-like FMN-containing flavoprotein (pyridoxamine 5'-phosphate oxidase superfamily)